MKPVFINEESFAKLVNPGRYQVFLLTSPIPYPFHLAVHSWFVTQVAGEFHRYEFGKFRGSPNPKGIGLLKDFFKPTTGMNCYWWQRRDRFPSKLIGVIEGDENSDAKHLAAFLETQSKHYPLKETYRYLGPNSNTFVGWVLKHFPNCGLKVPTKAVGRNHPVSILSITGDNKLRMVGFSKSNLKS